MTSDERRRAIDAWLAKADEALADAAILLSRESLTGTINRCSCRNSGFFRGDI
jgi:hypothetical protein